jgi:signal transduction histidine kinase
MFTVLTCLAQDHDAKLVGLAALICLISSTTSLCAFRRAQTAVGDMRIPWLIVTILVQAAGVWATHFIAMLAYLPELDMHYDVLLTVASFAVAAVGMGAGFTVALRFPSLIGRAAGGGLIGAAIGGMHFTGMAAVTTSALLIWNTPRVAASLVLGAVGAGAALAVSGRLNERSRLAWAAGLLIVAVCALHFTAMGALSLIPSQAVSPPAGLVSRHALAVEITAIVALIVLAALSFIHLDRVGSRATLTSLKDALDGAPSGIAFFDRDHRLVFWNRQYAAVLQAYGVSPALGLAFTSILEVALQGGLPAEFRAEAIDPRAFREGILLREFMLSDGRWMKAEIGPTPDGGFVVVISDITDQRTAALASLEARRDAEAASRAKSEFLANISHEIRTPLNAVLGMAEVMMHHPLDRSQRGRLEIIRDSGEALLGVLNNVLDISKIESGHFTLDEQPFDLEMLIQETCGPIAPLAARKGIEFKLELADAASGWWSGDALRLRQVVGNLLSNALKFTDTGRIRLLAEASANEVRITVEDTGVGISAMQLGGIFDRFSQADNSPTRRFGGTGLGLAVCRELMQLMGGRIEVSSEPGQGSSFTISLPMQKRRAPTISATTDDGPGVSQTRPLRILGAEDNPTNQMILAALLEPLNVELCLVADGLEALEAFKTAAFDLVLLDVQMPPMDGVQVTLAIREWEALVGRPQTPILALTANVMSHQTAKYLAAGMSGVIPKPIVAKVLFEGIEAATSRPTSIVNSCDQKVRN